MSGYHILAQRSRQSLGAISKPSHLGWWLAGAAVVAGGYLALRNRDAISATARRRVLLAGLAAGGPGCRTQLYEPPRQAVFVPAPPGYVHVDFGSSPDLGDSPDLADLPDMAVAPDMTRLPDLTNGADMIRTCCVAGSGCFIIDPDGGLIQIDTGDAGEFFPPWCP